jgi:hypothetical protein
MQKKILVIILILLILITSTTLCFNSEKKPKTLPEGPWLDLTNFNNFLTQNFEITYKEDSGAGIIKAIEEPEGALYIAVGVDEPFTESETVALHQFVESGGNLIVAADDETVNDLALEFGLEFSPHAILDKGFDYNYTFIPLVVEESGNIFSIIVHSPHGIEISAASFKVIGQSSEFPGTINSVLDLNDNKIIDSEDRPGPIPIIVKVTVGLGKAIFVSDAGLFSDNLWKLFSIYDKPEFEGHVYENQEYIGNLIFNLHETGKDLIVDRSKHSNNFSNFHPYPKPE